MSKHGLGGTVRALVFATWLRVKPLDQKLTAFADGLQRSLGTILSSLTSMIRRPCRAI
jgi:hypothetical protein